MAVITKNKPALIVTAAVQRRAGIKPGDLVEYRVSSGVITILKKQPAADDEYTADQRQLIDGRLDEASKGPYYGPFQSAEEAIQFLNRGVKAPRASKRKAS